MTPSRSPTKMQTAFVGLLEDRCLVHPIAVGTVTLISAEHVATCAHLLVPYIDNLAALKVRFSPLNREFGVAEVLFHRDFNLKTAAQLADRYLKEPSASLSLQKNNVAILTLSESLPALTEEAKSALNLKLSAPPVKTPGLSGGLADVDLALVIQTLTNGRRSGSLVICDDRSIMKARIFCHDGRITQAQFGTLENERAVYQIFSQQLTGCFYFKPEPEADWKVQGSITSPTDMLLIESHRRVDEIPELLLRIGGEESLIQKIDKVLDLQRIKEEVRADVQHLWPHVDGTVPTGRLWKLAQLDDYSVFKSLSELMSSGHIAIQEVKTSVISLSPVKLGHHLPLKPLDLVQLYGFDSDLDAARHASGKLLGTLNQNDPYHLIHNLRLPADAAGAPVLKDGFLVGIHCGSLPTDAGQGEPAIARTLSQFVWSEGLMHCDQIPSVNFATTKRTSRSVSLKLSESMAMANLSSTDTADPKSDSCLDARQDSELNTSRGCLEIAQVECPRCGPSSIDSKGACSVCGLAIINGIIWADHRKTVRTRIIVSSLSFCVVILLGAVIYLLINPIRMFTSGAGIKSGAASSSSAVSFDAGNPANAPVAIALQRVDKDKDEFVDVPEAKTIKSSDLLRFRLKVLVPGFIYVFSQSASNKAVGCWYPADHGDDTMVLPDSIVTIPRADRDHELDGFAISGGRGTDTVLVLHSQQRLPLSAYEDQYDKIFSACIHALRRNKNNSAQISTAELGFESSQSLASGNSIYMSEIKISH